MLLDVKYTEERPRLEYNLIESDVIFIGTDIKNEYDERRICLKNINDQAPQRYTFKPYHNSESLFVYGFCFEPKQQDRFLMSELGKLNETDSISYNNLLAKYNYTCTDNFLKINKNVFPVDPCNIQRYIPEYKYENLICFNDDIPDFQGFTSINMYFLSHR
jgi:hypothetical protein